MTDADVPKSFLSLCFFIKMILNLIVNREGIFYEWKKCLLRGSDLKADKLAKLNTHIVILKFQTKFVQRAQGEQKDVSRVRS